MFTNDLDQVQNFFQREQEAESLITGIDIEKLHANNREK